MKYRGVIHAGPSEKNGCTWNEVALALWDVQYMNDEYFTEGCRTCGWFGEGLKRIQDGDKLTIFEYKPGLIFTHDQITGPDNKVLWSGVIKLVKPDQTDLTWSWDAIPETPDYQIVMNAFMYNAPAELEMNSHESNGQRTNLL